MTFCHLADAENLARHAGTCDVLICREFFIHQNFASATIILRLAAYLLKPAGHACADFYYAESHAPGLSFGATEAGDPQYPSAGFHYSEREIELLAAATGFDIVSNVIEPIHERRFVIFARSARTAASPG